MTPGCSHSHCVIPRLKMCHIGAMACMDVYLLCQGGDTCGLSYLYPTQYHFEVFHMADYVYDLCLLSDPDVCRLVLVRDVEHTHFLLSVLVCGAASLFCACFGKCPFLHHMSQLAGSTQELHTCLSRQMARLILKRFRCLAYAAQPDMILRFSSLS